MDSKSKVLLLASGAGISGFISWLATATPEVQSGILSSLVECVPIHYRPQAAWISKTISTILGVWALYEAHKPVTQSSIPTPQAGAVQTTIKP